MLKEYQIFHIKHTGVDTNCVFNEVKFSTDNTMHIMGSHQDLIRRLILFKRDRLTGKKFWRSPIHTIEHIIRKKAFPDIGGKIQLGISAPEGFRLQAIYNPNDVDWYFNKTRNPKLFYQGVDLYYDPFLTKLGECFIETSSILKESR